LAVEYQQRVVTPVLARQLLQQCLRLLQVGGVKAISKPPGERCEELVRLGALTLALPEAHETQGGAQLPGSGLLPAGNGKGLLETGFGLGGIRDRPLQQQDALEAIRLREQITLPAGLERYQGLGQ
jgi:hypothetical protein